MTLTTFGMEELAKVRKAMLSLSAAKHHPLDFINEFLPKGFPGKVIMMRHDRSEYSLRGEIYAKVEFDEYGFEDFLMEIPIMTQDIDIFERLVFCIKQRLIMLNGRKGKHLSTLVKNLYKGVK